MRAFVPPFGPSGRRTGALDLLAGRWRTPRAHSGGISLVYLVFLWALSSGVTGRMGWALLSSKVSALSGALGWLSCGLGVPLHLDPQLTVWVLPLEAVLHRALPPDQVTPVVVVVGLLDSRAWLEFSVRVRLWRCLYWEGG